MSKRRLSLLVATVLIVITACSPGNPQPPAAPPTATSEASVAPPTNTLPPAAPTDIPAPTAEPSQPTGTPMPEATSTATATATATATQRARTPASTPRSRNTPIPLSVSYNVVEIKRLPGDEATLVLKVIVTGGSGGYRYYHDNIQQPTATFNIPGRCGKPFVHTIKVIAGDGQTVDLPYHVNGVCPTPTP